MEGIVVPDDLPIENIEEYVFGDNYGNGRYLGISCITMDSREEGHCSMSAINGRLSNAPEKFAKVMKNVPEPLKSHLIESATGMLVVHAY